MLRHFLELLRASHRMILASAAAAGLVALVLSVLLLNARPLYEASVTVSMEPSEEELRFNRSFMGVSQFNPATIIAQSHIERLLSRPVAERALALLTAELGQIPAKPPSLLSALSTRVWQVWNTLNYGYSVQLDDQQQMLADLQNAISVEIVEGSYILNIAVSYDDAAIAAQAANALARAYVEEARDGFRRDAAEIAATIATAEDEAQRSLSERRQQRQALAAELGVADPVAERAILLQAREDARAALRTAEAELSGEERRLATLRQSLATQADGEIARGIRESLATGQAGLDRLTELRAQRQQGLTEIAGSLVGLDEAQTRLSALDEQIAGVETDLAQLQALRVASELSSRARLSQVMIINPATVPLYPRFPKVAVNTVVAVLVGAILALVPVLARDALGSQLRTALDVEQLGARALPSLSRRRIARGRRLGPGEVDRLVRRIAADRGGWHDRVLLVTGFLPQDDIHRLARVLDGAAGSDGTPIQAVPLLPLTAIEDWTALPDQPLLVALRSGELARSELALMQETAVRGQRPEPYYLVVL